MRSGRLLQLQRLFSSFVVDVLQSSIALLSSFFFFSSPLLCLVLSQNFEEVSKRWPGRRIGRRRLQEQNIFVDRENPSNRQFYPVSPVPCRFDGFLADLCTERLWGYSGPDSRTVPGSTGRTSPILTILVPT